MDRPKGITAEILVEANARAGRPPITLEEAQQHIETAVELGYLLPAEDSETETPTTAHDTD